MTSRKKPKAAALKLPDRCTIAEVAELNAQLAALLADPAAQEIRVDCTEVLAIDGASLQCLAAAAKSTREGQRLVFVDPTPELLKAAEWTGMGTLFAPAPTP